MSDVFFPDIVLKLNDKKVLLCDTLSRRRQIQQWSWPDEKKKKRQRVKKGQAKKLRQNSVKGLTGLESEKWKQKRGLGQCIEIQPGLRNCHFYPSSCAVSSWVPTEARSRLVPPRCSTIHCATVSSNQSHTPRTCHAPSICSLQAVIWTIYIFYMTAWKHLDWMTN